MAIAADRPGVDWEAIYATSNFEPLWHFTRGTDRVVVNARDVGGAVEIWILHFPADRRPSREVRRVTTAAAIDACVRETKQRFLTAGWTIVERRPTLEARR